MENAPSVSHNWNILKIRFGIFALFVGQKCPIFHMNGNELLKILKRIGKQRGLVVRLDRKRGRGSHFTLYLGNKRTIMKDRTKEIGPGLLKKILDNLSLNKKDIE